MDIDEEFEFECPKFYDFENAPPDDQSFSSGLNDSWFERDHPLHEPKNPVKPEEALKPLINLDELKPATTLSKKAPPAKTNNAKKYKNAKKSLGVKPSVRLKRGEHGPAGQAKAGTKAALQRNKSLGGKIAKDIKLKSLEILESKDSLADEFCSSQARTFTPPWRVMDSCAASTMGSTVPCDVQGSPLTSQSKLLVNSPLCGPEPVRGTQGTAVSAAMVSLFSPPLRSPRNALLPKAGDGAVRKARPRRLLPKIPSQGVPVRGGSQSDDKDTKFPTVPLDEIPDKTKTPSQRYEMVESPFEMPARGASTNRRSEGDGSSIKEQCEETEFSHRLESRSRPCSSLSDETDSGNSGMAPADSRIEELGVDNHVKPNRIRQKDTGVSSHSESKSRPCSSLSDETESGISGMDQVDSRNGELSVEDLLKQHNQRVKPKPQYDANGRRIKSAASTFCPAPSKSEVVGQKTIKSSKLTRRSVSSASNPTTTVPKRPPSITESTKPKQSDTSKPDKTQPPMKRCMSTSEIRNSQKQKRRSCQVEPSKPTLPQASKAAGKTGAKQKRRSCMAAPQAAGRTGDNLDRTDKDLMDLIARHNERLATHKS